MADCNSKTEANTEAKTVAAPAEPAALTDEEYEQLVQAAPPGTDAWQETVEAITGARGGKYPSDWYARILSDPAKFPMNWKISSSISLAQ